MYVFVCVYIYIDICVHTCIHVYIYIYVYIYIHIYVNIYKYIYNYMYIHNSPTPLVDAQAYHTHPPRVAYTDADATMVTAVTAVTAVADCAAAGTLPLHCKSLCNGCSRSACGALRERSGSRSRRCRWTSIPGGCMTGRPALLGPRMRQNKWIGSGAAAHAVMRSGWLKGVPTASCRAFWRTRTSWRCCAGATGSQQSVLVLAGHASYPRPSPWALCRDEG